MLSIIRCKNFQSESDQCQICHNSSKKTWAIYKNKTYALIRTVAMVAKRDVVCLGDIWAHDLRFYWTDSDASGWSLANALWLTADLFYTAYASSFGETLVEVSLGKIAIIQHFVCSPQAYSLLHSSTSVGTSFQLKDNTLHIRTLRILHARSRGVSVGNFENILSNGSRVKASWIICIYL